ncbi:reactive intermediate/imine deaminase [Thermocatellispora tengchongensis]|uniref:Reactive intermediate/imine deaminase n=1 Tax=Thermocatellispora tengchongensis TaxID=1073253 RepID=A0A840PLF5_9ACTN|nr:RidA family protein [Thermocatellispora tengchongensis]MBB5138450.1 reactive intermediate/imine deaminase [Thermocatellispora tengchongensis]
MTAAGSAADPVPSAASPAPYLIDSPDLMPPAGHYSHVVVHRGLAYISGQLPVTPEGEKLGREPFGVQAEQVLRNIDACLDAAGTGRHRLLSVTVYVTDIADWPEFDRLYALWMGAHRPQRAVAGVKELHYGAAVEVHAIAALD